MNEYVENYISISTFGLLVAVFLGYAVCRKLYQTKNLPPGPITLPIVGYLPFLGKYPNEKFAQLSKKYGNIFSLYLGSRFVVVLNDWPAIKEAYSKVEFLARPHNSPFEIEPDDNSGIVSLSGEKWVEQRRFTLHMLRDLGLGKNRLEDSIKEEIAEVLDIFKKSKGNPVLLDEMLLSSMSNNISALLFGRRFDFDDPNRKLLDKVIMLSTKVLSQVAIHCFMPWLKPLIRLVAMGVYRDAMPTKAKFDAFVIKEVEEHRATLDENNKRDYIDGFLTEIEKKKSEKDTSFTDDMLKGNVLALFGAGSETVKTSVTWGLLTMAAFPDIQRKIQNEIDEIIGTERTPSWKDHPQLPYTQATLLELSRWKTVTPLSILRSTSRDAKLGKYDIPEGTIIIANLGAVHYDGKYWKKPDKFEPERFLETDGSLAAKPDYLIPFSYGKRSCPGETMANVEVFLYFTSILQSYNVLPEEGATVDLKGELGVSLQPKSQKLRLVSRR